MEAKPLRLAADTNVLLDLADRDEDVLDAVALIDRRLPASEWFVTTSVLDELAFLADSGNSASLRQSARRAFQDLQSKSRFRPLLELPFPFEHIEQVADEFRRLRLLPAEEVHDARVLAEASFLGCAMLLTSDEHLRGVDHEGLTLALRPFDLLPPVIATPRELVRKFFH